MSRPDYLGLRLGWGSSSPQILAKCRAHRLVRRAVKDGALPHPSTLKCVDCGEPAIEYDHRSYADPVRVYPVCHPCNCRRGPADDSPVHAHRKLRVDPELLPKVPA